MLIKHLAALGICAATVVSFAGCNSQTPSEIAEPVEISGPPPEFDGEHEGPHGGHVIELGRSHAFHAEIVESAEDRSLTVYVLDSDLQQRAIEQQTIRLGLIVDGQSQSFVLNAVDAVNGKASAFRSDDVRAFEALHEHHASGKLLVTIDGKSYSGDIEHHDHAGHDHEGHDHAH